MATTYAMHYSPYVKGTGMYDPLAASMMGGYNARIAPVCRIRGRKDVTNDVTKVTCGKCKAAALKAQAAKGVSA
jgi:hypothetical protein